MAASGPVDLLSRSLDQTGALIGGITVDQIELPTPCRSWDVRALVQHLLTDLLRFTVRAQGGQPTLDDVAQIEGDPAAWARDFSEGAARLVSAWRSAGPLDGTLTVPGLGDVPARFPVDQQATEFAVHSWDLARATGAEVDLDPEIGRFALDWARGALSPRHRGSEADGKAFGPEVAVPADAPVCDRLAGFFGRVP